MDSKIKTKWLKALRSGLYQQTDGKLEDTHGKMCCLGVLMACQGVTPRGYAERLLDDNRAFSFNTTTVPPEFSAGLTQDEASKLAIMNDGGTSYDDGVETKSPKHNFGEIADYIEANI